MCEGDTVVVNVENHLANGEATTIHWHGMYQRGTQWMDGVPMLTQCPIAESASLQYTFVAQPAGCCSCINTSIKLNLLIWLQFKFKVRIDLSFKFRLVLYR